MNDLQINVNSEIRILEKSSAILPQPWYPAGRSRIDHIAYLHLVEGRSIKEICRITGLRKTRVYECILRFKESIGRELKQDIRMNKMVTDHMISLIEQSKERTRIIWEGYDVLDGEFKRIVSILRQLESQDSAIGECAAVPFRRRCLTLHKRMQGCIKASYRETRCMLDIWKAFGLCNLQSDDIFAADETENQNEENIGNNTKRT